MLEINNLKVGIEYKIILNGINLKVQCGEIHAMMGPNGSGKSTFAQTLMGNSRYKIIDGQILFLEQNLNKLAPDQRARLGIFLAFQYPYEIEGLRVKDFLRESYNAVYGQTDRRLDLKQFNDFLNQNMNLLKINSDFLNRNLNVGFSGGEKKLLEILQMAVLQPKLVILDEIDSGLDVNALRVVCDGINVIRNKNPGMSFLIITHYARILKYLTPDFVHIFKDGQIVRSGDSRLANQIETHGYE
ncbi:Fe-S cluster assembly ATPase SufC [Candidatus Dependentiae bacterium]|nr:Fe-S cluster assembly ATPase SufC [Candidatus Dependentiae bacterium]